MNRSDKDSLCHFCIRVMTRAKCGGIQAPHLRNMVVEVVWFAATGTGSLVFIDDVTYASSSRINSGVRRSILSAEV